MSARGAEQLEHVDHHVADQHDLADHLLGLQVDTAAAVEHSSSDDA